MSKDSVCLFDKRLWDESVRLDRQGLETLRRSHRAELDEWSLFRDSMDDVLRGGEKLEMLKELMMQELCELKPRISLDYWACYAEVFAGDPPGAIPDYAIFPHIQEQGFLLLSPERIQSMLASLESPKDEVTIMTDEQIAMLASWRARCIEDPGLKVAYFINA